MMEELEGLIKISALESLLKSCGIGDLHCSCKIKNTSCAVCVAIETINKAKKDREV